MAEKLLRHWKSDRHEGMVEYMKATNVNFALRQVAPKLTVYEEISRNGDEWTINMTSTFKNHKLVFKLGEPFVDNTVDGKTMKTTFTLEGDKLVGVQEPMKKGEIPAKFIREVTDDGEMMMTLIALTSNVECSRWFKPYNP